MNIKTMNDQVKPKAANPSATACVTPVIPAEHSAQLSVMPGGVKYL